MDDLEYAAEVGMLGTLRSELDDESDLDPIFVSMQLAHNAVINAYGAQKISSHAAGMILKDLKLKGTDGYYWTIGASTRSWYKRLDKESGTWETATEPEGVSLDGEAPFWYVRGVASLISEISQLDSQVKAEEEKDDLVKESETYEEAEEDLDWIFDEWDRGVEVAELESPVKTVGTMGLPENMPSTMDPDEDLTNSLQGPDFYPHERVSGEIFDALDEQEQEFAGMDNELEDNDPSAEVQRVEVDVDGLIGTKTSKLEDYFIPYEDSEVSTEQEKESFVKNLEKPPTETTSLTPLERGGEGAVKSEAVESDRRDTDVENNYVGDNYSNNDALSSEKDSEEIVREEYISAEEEGSIYIDGTNDVIEYYMEDSSLSEAENRNTAQTAEEGSIYILDEDTESSVSDGGEESDTSYIGDEYTYPPE